MPIPDTKPKRIAVVFTALLVVVSSGGAVATVSNANTAAQIGATETVTAEDVTARQVTMENVNVTGVSFQLGEALRSGVLWEQMFRAALSNGTEGFQARNIRVDNVRSASVTIENNVVTMDANIQSVTFTRVEARRVNFSDAAGTTTVVQALFDDQSLNAETITAQGLSVGSLTVEPAPEPAPVETETATPVETETPAETETATPVETETPAETETEAPVETVTEAPAETETEAPVETETEAPVETETEAPVETVTEAPAETAAPNETETATPTEASLFNGTSTPE